MNSDEIKSFSVLALTLLATVLATHGVTVSHDQVLAMAGDLSIIIPAGVSLVGTGTAIYRQWNMKKVPENSTALQTSAGLPLPSAPKGENISVGGIATKVVGALLFGILLMGSQAHAQTAVTKTTAPASVVANLIANINKVSLADLQNAAALAHAANNITTASCWDALVTMLQKQQLSGQPTTGTTAAPALPVTHLFTDVEKVSELLQALQPGGTIQVNCAAMADAASKSVLQIVTGIVSGTTALPLLPAIP